MPKYTLTYFNTEAIAESIRFLFAYGDIKFDDIRYEYSEWPEYKSKFKFGQLPVLQIDNVIINQSLAIGRYIAREVNLLGADNLEEAQICALVETINEFRSKSYEPFKETEHNLRNEKKQIFLTTTAPYYLSRFDEMIQQNGGYFVLSKLTWADIFFSGLDDLFRQLYAGDLLDGFQNIVALINRVRSIPGIAKWIEKRPKITCKHP